MFEKNKSIFKNKLETPLKMFIVEMISTIEKFSGFVGVSGKVFRIYKDARFSKSTEPYDNYLRMALFLKGPGSVAFMLSIEPNDKLILGGGIFVFTKEQRDSYRRKVVDNGSGQELRRILNVAKEHGFILELPSHQRVPKPYDNDHVRGDLLKAKGISLWHKQKFSKELYSPGAVEYCFEVYKKIFPLIDWLNKL